MRQQLNESNNKNFKNYFYEILFISTVSLSVYLVSHTLEIHEKINSLLGKYEFPYVGDLFLAVAFVLLVIGLFFSRKYFEIKKEFKILTVTKDKLLNEVDQLSNTEQNLKNSEEKYRNFIDQSSNAIYLQEDGKYEIVNNNFLKLFGITREEVNAEGFTLLDYTHPDSLFLLEERKRKAKAGEILSSTYEYTGLTKDKRAIEIEATVSYLYNDGKLQTQGVLRDISKRKRSENIQSAVYLISEAANSTQNLEELITNIHEIIKLILFAENFYVVFYDQEKDLYELSYFVDQYDTVDEKTMDLKGTLTDYVRRTEVATIINENRHAQLVKTGEAKYVLKPSKTWMGAPLKTPDGVIGVIAVQSYEDVDLYSSEDLELLSMISGQIARALEKKRVEEEKEKNRKFFKTVINTLDNPLFVINVIDSTIAIANTAAKNLFLINESHNRDCYGGVKKNGSSCKCDSISCPISKLLRTKTLVKFEQTITSVDNIVTLYEVYAFPILNEHGEVVQVIENLVDISERKRFENKLSELAVFPESNPNIVMSINSKEEVIYMNPATYAILSEFGISKHMLHNSFPNNLSELIKTMLQDGCGIENINVSIDGHILSWSFHPVIGQDIIHCYASDITKLVQQTEEINKLSMVATHSSNLVMVTNSTGAIEYVNPYFTLITGYSKEDVVNKNVNELKSGKNSKELYEELWSLISKGETWNGKIENKKKNGEHYWESKTISPISNETGEITNYISVGNDITNEIQIQNKLVESEKFSAIATLAAGVAHEFKNYLGGIIGNASFSLDEIDSEDGLLLAKETLSKIIEMGEKANNVAMSLLTFSKAKPEDMQKEDLKKIIIQSITLVEKEFEILGIEIVSHFDQVPPTEVSFSKIQQLLLNLFINAKHAIGTNGVITVALLDKNDFVEIRIGDSGGGIAKEHIDKIFDPFYSTKGVWGKDKVSGTGMGLSICRNIAREHKGDLVVDSIKGVGTVFTISLPILKNSDIKIQNKDRFSEKNIIIFTLNHTILTHYYNDVCSSRMNLLLVDNFAKIDKSIMHNTAFVVCDAKFSAKLELYRMVELCMDSKQPYIMINCGTMEYQLEEIYNNSIINYKELPDFDKLITDFESVQIVNIPSLN